MEENVQLAEGEIVGIRFSLATHKEVCAASISDCPISHSTQLTNPFLGLPLEFGKCESCGTAEPGQCEGHFGYIELPVPIYHPSHISELKRLLSLLCLKCLKLKNSKLQMKNVGMAERIFSCCEEAAQVSIIEVKKADGACFLELKLPQRAKIRWNFLERYGFRYGDDNTRPLLPVEVMEMLKRIPEDTRKKLSRKGYFPQDGYVLRYLPVPPNCLSVPDISDGTTFMSSDLSTFMLKKVLKQVVIIKGSRSGLPNFESHEVEAIDLQVAVDQYLQVRGTVKTARDVEARFGVNKEASKSSTKAWLEKMRTLFIRKGCGFSSRSVITGDAYKQVNEIGIPYEIAQRITFEERVNVHNMRYLQELVDKQLCLTYKDGSTTFSLREGSKGHTCLRLGQVVHRRIRDGDMVFINRPPTTHKHSLQALSVYIHDDHTVKISPLICGPLSADFDGDCIHLFYPQSLAAKAEVLELFSVEKQLLSSHSGNLNLQLTSDSLLSLKTLHKDKILDHAMAQELVMFVSDSLPKLGLLMEHPSNKSWTFLKILQTCLPASFNCFGEKYSIKDSQILEFDLSEEVQSIMNEILASIFFEKGANSVLQFFNSLQPLLMEYLFSCGFSFGLNDFFIPKAELKRILKGFNNISPLLGNLRLTHNELVEMQVENRIRSMKVSIGGFISDSPTLGCLVDSRSESAISKVVQQVGFLGLQVADRGKFYSKTLVEDMASHFERNYPLHSDYPSAKYGLIRGCFVYGLDPYEEMVHSISAREVMVRSSRGLSEPGTLFKNLMAILRDVVVCYDGTVRNVSSNSIVQFEYGVKVGVNPESLFPAGEPVGVLAATAMSNPAYKAVLDSTPSSNSSWEMMKEILLCKVSFKNDLIDRRVILYLNDCCCGRKYCVEEAAHMVKNHLQKVSLRDIARSFMVEYRSQQTSEGYEMAGLFGHVHLSKKKLQKQHIGMQMVHQKCQETLNSFQKKKKVGSIFKRTALSVSECCSFQQSCDEEMSGMPCIAFCFQDNGDNALERIADVLTDMIYPVLSEATIKGDHRISTATITWISPDATSWIRNPSKTRNGELVIDVALEKSAVKQSGDAWRIVLDCCLPILHLIDTTRSIPYAIKQVQELLGVSCTFDQAVQRLSTSVTKVAKGVLKEHLILLANSMTCTGNLVGFNTGGYKALSRSFDIQVPFAEATLFTPKRCFERAAEKCHVDTLSSVVASCSWGKRVAVGTGAGFDLLWDRKEASLNQDGSLDIYNFLNMVRSAGTGDEIATACLGAEVDDLMMDTIDDWNPSPERNSELDKPVFEDSAEIQNGHAAWDRKGEDEILDNPGNSSGGWETKAVNKKENVFGKAWDQSTASDNWNSSSVRGWNSGSTSTTKAWEQPANGNTIAAWERTGEDKSPNEPENFSDDWGTKTANEEENVSGKAWQQSTTDDWNSGSASGGNVGGWNSGSTHGRKASEQSTSWNAIAASESKGDDKNTGYLEDSSGGWETAMNKQEHISGKAWEQTTRFENWNTNSGSSPKAWEQPATGNTAWERKGADGNSDISDAGGWNSGSTCTPNAWKQSATGNAAWERKGEDENTYDPRNAGSWNSGSSPKAWEPPATRNAAWEKKDGDENLDNLGSSRRGWKSKTVNRQDNVSGKAWEQTTTSDDWNSGSASGGDATGWSSGSTRCPKTWKQAASGNAIADQERNGEDKSLDNPGNSSGGWNKQDNVTGKVWGQSTTPDNWNSVSADCGDAGGWNSASADGGDAGGWNSGSKRGGDDGGWNSGSTRGGDDGGWNTSSTRGRKGWEQPASGRSGTSSGNWKNKKYPAKPPRNQSDDFNASGMFTLTRQRLDMFTSEEQDILSDVEPLMRSIRRIIHNSGYNDGDPLSADDQSYVIDNVFNYHPDKVVKMGAGIDHITVSKHSSFQDSRCFYVVSTDGQRQDFSYRKCLESFIKGKYPDLAEEFVGKYFARTRGSRQRNPVPDGTGDGTVGTSQPTPMQESAGDGNRSGDGILPTPLSTATQ